jgi:hypothetical protein
MNAASRYLARLYESAVDSGLDLGAIRLYLASRGIARSPGQLLYDLDHNYAFHGYAASHPAPTALSLAQIDRQFER